MAVLLRKYRKLFAALSIAVAGVFILSTVSVAYTHIFCKSNNSEAKVVKSCCHSGAEETALETEGNCHMNNIKTGSRIEKEHKCCCEVSQTEAQDNQYAPVITTQSSQTKIHPGTLVSILPVSNQIITSVDNSSGDRSPTQGRSIIILVSNFRI